MQNQAPSMLKPALISGVAFGVAGAIPMIELINCACCALIIGCGLLAAFLQSKQCRQAGVEFRGGAGATVGLVGGMVYGVVTGVLGGLISAATGMDDWQQAIEQIQSSGADIDPAVLDQITRFMEGSGPLVLILAGIFFWLVVGAIFGTIGGLIGGSVFKVEAQPQEGSPPPPPPIE